MKLFDLERRRTETHQDHDFLVDFPQHDVVGPIQPVLQRVCDELNADCEQDDLHADNEPKIRSTTAMGCVSRERPEEGQEASLGSLSGAAELLDGDVHEHAVVTRVRMRVEGSASSPV